MSLKHKIKKVILKTNTKNTKKKKWKLSKEKNKQAYKKNNKIPDKDFWRVFVNDPNNKKNTKTKWNKTETV